MLFSTTTVAASSPSLGVIQPRGAQRGTDAVLTFPGNNLSDAKEILFHTPGFAVTKLEVVNNTAVKATVKIAADCRLGEHGLRVRTASGISEMRSFYVGALPTVDEKEPNSEFTVPQKIALNVTVHGVIDNEDVDYFAVECKKGQRLSAEVEAMRLGNQLFDPYVAILDAKRFELAANDDAPLLGQDACCSVVIPADGTYFVQVRESAYGGNGAFQYRLHVGHFPRPTAVVPAGGKPGDEVEVRFLGDPTGEIKQKVKLPAVADPNFRLFVQDAGGISPSGIPFRLIDLPNAVQTASNVTPPTALAGTAPGAFNGVIANNGESNFYKFAAKKGQVYDIHCYARRLGSPLDPVIYINAVGAGAFGSNDDTAGPDSYMRVTIPEDKEYNLAVYDHLLKGGPTYFYRLEVTPVAAEITTSLPRNDQFNPANQDRTMLPVPKGNRYATLVRATRKDLGGPLTLNLENLPPGVTATFDPMDAGLDVVPVVLEAKADAALSGSLVKLNAKPVDVNAKAPCRTTQEQCYVIGQNQAIFWRYHADTVATAVTEAVPFEVTVIEPKAPVVQNGSLNVKVVAKRLNGFKGPIAILPLFNPPGISSANEVVIPDGATEIMLPLNAAGNAAPRKWRTAVQARATVGNGPVWTSSQLFTIEIAPPFVAFTMERAASEQGKPTTMYCKITTATPFTGAAKATIYGLPPKVTAPTLDLNKDTKELAFPLTVDKTAPPGQHKNIFCQVIVTQNGEQVVHNVGGTEVRIDVPLPPKPNAPAPVVAAAPPPKPAAPAAAPPKRLTRLEQLRLEQEEREKAMKAGTPPKQK